VAALAAAGFVRAQAGGEVKEAAKRELQRLQGGWIVVALETNGEKTKPEDLKQRTIFIGADAFLFKDGKEIMQVAKLKLDPTKTPRRVNAEIMKGPNKGDVMLGIYELKGDTLRICFDQDGSDRPTEFKTTANSNLTCIVCTRVPRADKDLPDITGSYRSESIELDGSRHTADATIERHGDAYMVTYHKNGKVAYIGIGIRRGDVFSLCWASGGQVGLSVYQIEKGRLVGQYTQLGGIGMASQETLTPRDKSD
jgi:uncharacterized protein (TIGR03067 family)